jgi:hypothetical protein
VIAQWLDQLTYDHKFEGSNLVTTGIWRKLHKRLKNTRLAAIAQWLDQLTYDHKFEGSNLVTTGIWRKLQKGLGIQGQQ